MVVGTWNFGVGVSAAGARLLREGHARNAVDREGEGGCRALPSKCPSADHLPCSHQLTSSGGRPAPPLLTQCGCKDPAAVCHNLTDLAPSGKCATYDGSPSACVRYRVGATPCKVLAGPARACRRDVSLARQCVILRVERLMLRSTEEDAKLRAMLRGGGAPNDHEDAAPECHTSTPPYPAMATSSSSSSSVGPLVYVYNVSVANFVPSDHPWPAHHVEARYQALLHEANVSEHSGRAASASKASELRLLRFGSMESMHPDGFLHRVLPAAARTTRCARRANVFLLPIWPYAACTALGEVSGVNYHLHITRTLYELCPSMARIYRWLFQQTPWRRSAGADHLLIYNYKDRLGGRYYAEKAGELVQEVGFDVSANSMLATTEDRAPHPERRRGCTSIDLPYFAPTNKWLRGGGARSDGARSDGARSDGEAFEAMVRAKRQLLAFFGNTHGFACHLEAGACPPGYAQTVHRLRVAIVHAVSRSNGTSVDLHRTALARTMRGGSDVHLLRQSLFCPCPPGDSFTAKRLFTAVLSLCVPILVYPERHPLPFRGDVDWEAFTLRVPQGPQGLLSGKVDLVALARGVPPTRLREMQLAMWKHREKLAFLEPGVHGVPRVDATRLLLKEAGSALTAPACDRPILVQRHSDEPCMHGRSFGQKGEGKMWVSARCRGAFVSTACWRRTHDVRLCPRTECPAPGPTPSPQSRATDRSAQQYECSILTHGW